MSALAFDLVAFVPWMDNGLQDEVVYASKMGPDGPIMMSRRTPDVMLGPDETLWLAKRGEDARVVRVRATEAPDVFLLHAAQLNTLTSLAPMPEAGLVLLGMEGSERVLARLSGAGELIWRTGGVLSEQGSFERVELLADLDGSTYVYATQRKAGDGGPGHVARIDLDDGTMVTVAEFERSPTRLMVRQGSLFWVSYADGVRSWVRQDIESGSQHAVEGHAALQSTAGRAYAVLPGGGALLGLSLSQELIWMGPDGGEIARLALAGVVRYGAGVAVGSREEDALVITHWEGGHAVNSTQVDSFPRSSGLIYAEQGMYYLLDPEDRIATVDPDGECTIVTPSTSVNQLRIQHQGAISIPGAVVAADGSVLLPGADPEGAYVVRIKGMPSER